MKNIYLVLLVGMITIARTGCSKTEVTGSALAENTKGKPTAVGAPVAPAITKTIGPEGGTIASADNSISIIVPAGAVTATTSFSIQPIENKTPNGIGSAYRLSPEGFQFTKPVTITFRYNDQMINGSLPGFLYIACQDKEGIWKAQLKTSRDLTNKTLSITSLHFSDWSVFENFRLDVEKPVLATNESTTLEVKEVNFLASLTNPEAELDEVRTTQKTGNWKLNGEGHLTASGATASYIAPAVEPDPNPVSISVEVSDIPTGNGTKGKVILFANIFVADNFMEVKFGDTFIRFTDAEAAMGGGMIMVNGSNGAAGINLNIYGGGSRSFDVKELTPTYVVASFGGEGYASFYDECNPRRTVATTGSISITAVGNVGAYIDGSFSGQLARGNGPCDNPGFISVSGRFHCKRTS
jgi:hypothetical protein